MHKVQSQVRDFHRAMGLPAPGAVTPLTREGARLRFDLITEEFGEFARAVGDPDAPASFVSNVTTDQVDALCDLLYVVYGTAVQMGIDIEPFFELVHEANMKKGPGPMRADGKKLKPDGWQPPDHEAELERQARGG